MLEDLDVGLADQVILEASCLVTDGLDVVQPRAGPLTDDDGVPSFTHHHTLGQDPKVVASGRFFAIASTRCRAVHVDQLGLGNRNMLEQVELAKGGRRTLSCLGFEEVETVFDQVLFEFNHCAMFEPEVCHQCSER